MTVEELFGRDDAVLPVAAMPVAPLGGTGARVTLAPIGDGYVALPLQGVTVSRGGFVPAGGLVADDDRDRRRMSRTVRPAGPPRPTLVAAGCDPALPLLESPLGLLDPPVAFSWWPSPSREALRPAAGGLVHDRISGVKDVAEGGLRLVNREPGAEARSLLDRALADAGIEGVQLPGYDTRADGESRRCRPRH
jgi:PBP superfamily domain